MMCFKFRKFLPIAIALLSVCGRASAQIDVVPAATAASLAQKLVGQGVSIANPTLNCAGQAEGIFTATAGLPGVSGGIVLTNGRAACSGTSYGVNGPSSLLASTDNMMPGDTALDALAGQTTYDACALEFDVIPNDDTVQFRYVFSSEEYKNAVCGSFNDAFAFFISGPGIAGADNMALVPGTTIPVTINSINDGVPGPLGNINNCTNLGPGSPFTMYYIDNSVGTTLTHQGLTQVLRAYHHVQPCATYHLKLVIADAGDPLYDSGVFLEAGSLKTVSYTISTLPQAPTVPPICIKGCLNGRIRVSKMPVTNHPQALHLIIGGSAVPGLDYLALPDSVVIPAFDSIIELSVVGFPTADTAVKRITLALTAPVSCSVANTVLDSASILIYDSLHITATPHTLYNCTNGAVQLLASGPNMLSYSWSPTIGLNNPYVPNPTTDIHDALVYHVVAQLPGTSCLSNVDSISVSIRSAPVINMPTDTLVCYSATIQLSLRTPDTATYSYSWTGPAGYSSTAMRPTIANITVANVGTYSVAATDSGGCTSSDTLWLFVNQPDTPGINAILTECSATAMFTPLATGNHVNWYDGTNDSLLPAAPAINLSALNKYSYWVSDTHGRCEGPKKEVVVDVVTCCDGVICIPTAFSPNNDGKNDHFEVLAAYGYTIKTLIITNRWGQVVYEGTRGVWDGSFKGKPADVGTYFYYLELGCLSGGTTVKRGDVILVR